MKKLLIALALFSVSIVSFAQEHKKIELSFMDYTESDSSFYNTDVPENHYTYDNFDLYYRFEGSSEWIKVKKGKELTKALKANEASSLEAKKYIRKKRIGKIVVIGGLAGGAFITITSLPIVGIGVIVVSGGAGLLIISKSDKHLFKAIHQYNSSLK
jgi:hypothetical protein